MSALAVPPLPIVPQTGRISLQWDASPSPGVVNYRLFHSTNNATWRSNLVGNVTSVTVTNVAPGSSNWFLVTAVNADGLESLPSNVVEKPMLSVPAPPTGLNYVPVVVAVERRIDGGPWQAWRRYTNHFETSGQASEFRAVVTAWPPIEALGRPAP